MEVKLDYTDEFLRQAKRLGKKYRSLKSDLAVLMGSLEENPLQGTDLGCGFRKIRMAISAKGKGKSAGARVITYNVVKEDDYYCLTLLTIYDKSEINNVSDNYLQSLIQGL